MKTKKQGVNIEGEKRYEQVFGDTFAMYSNKEMEEFIEPFKIRFERNGLDAKKIFAGKNCFDGGCGNGRGTIFMLMNGAESVTSYDFSKKNIENTRRYVRQFGYEDRVNMKQGSLEKIPFDDETFDFVWCNGVIMHTKHPNKCLSEISRILKVNGRSWIYVYGSGGIYWRIIYHLREMVKDIKIQECIAVLKLYRYPTRYIAEYIDDWYATYLRTYTHKDLSERLVALSFEKPELLKYGTDYDTSHRRNSFTSSKQKVLMGEGDLRYLLKKTSNVLSEKNLLLEGEYGSDYHWPEVVTKTIDPLFKRLTNAIGDRNWLKIAGAAHIQRELRLELSKEESLNLKSMIVIIKNIIQQAGVIKAF